MKQTIILNYTFFAILFFASTNGCRPDFKKTDDAPSNNDKYKEVLRSIKEIQERSELIEITSSNKIRFDLRYATENNFMRVNLYGPFKKCYLHKIAADKLQKAAELLSDTKEGYALLLSDCLRPRSVQRILYETVRGTNQQGFVGNPDKGSIHNFGFAVDLTIVNDKGQEINMGTPFDSFEELSRPDKESLFLSKGKIECCSARLCLMLAFR